MARTTVKELEVRVDKIEKMLGEQNDLMRQMMTMLSNGSNNTKSASETKVKITKEEREAKREAEKADFKATHKLVRSSKENKALVYAEMKKQGITEFNRKDYERIAKDLGVLGASGKVVSTWEEIK